MLDHPEIEVYYERQDQADSLVEDYDVFVDEDCASCHENFLIQAHFNPLIPAHTVSANWNNLPWWFDTKYLTFSSANQPAGNSSSDTYLHVQSQQRTFSDSPQSGGYLPASSGGSSSSSESSSSSNAVDKASQNERPSVDRQINNKRLNSKSVTSKRKFRKRK